MKILVVEDGRNVSEIVVKYLKKDNYRVLLAENGMDALNMFHSFSPDLIVMEISSCNFICR